MSFDANFVWGAATASHKVEAAHEGTFAMSDSSLWNTAWWADLVILGHYPEVGLLMDGDRALLYPDTEMAIKSLPLDFCGSTL